MKIDIRPATLDDVMSIAEIIQLAFDQIPNTNRISQQVMSHHQFIYVALVTDQVVGFVENFITISGDYEIRLELDLLAVHPTAQGQGIGRKLIEFTIQLGRQLRVDHIRALIAARNARMQYLCASIGLTKSLPLSGLYVAEVANSRQACTHDLSEVQLILVTTLTYSGVWLEGVISQQAIHNAHALAIPHKGEIIGIVSPKNDLANIQLFIDSQFNFIDDYHRWTLIV